MCGIAGIVLPSNGTVTAAELSSISQAIHHRGPDDVGFLGWRRGTAAIRSRSSEDAGGGQVGFVHRRLSILDLSPLGWQPMCSKDGRWQIVFNGEIYNYIELREELQRAGDVFESHSDTEVMLAALVRWGEAAIGRLVGMFAFALLDTIEGKLLLARDPFGIKPLFWTQRRGGIAFASELKGLLVLDGISREADATQLYDYLAFGETDYDDRTFLKDVHQLEGGHLLRIRVGEQVHVEQPVAYWQLKTDTEVDLSFPEAVAAVRASFIRNVELHLRSDVPVGAALSGGIDSSSIVGCMRFLEPKLDLHAFSYYAEDERLNESRWIEQVTKVTGARGHVVRLAGETLISTLEKVMKAQDEPFTTTSIAAQYLVFQSAANAGVRVMLDGQGADEMLGGYSTFYGPVVAQLVRSGRLLTAGSLWRSLAAGSQNDRSQVSRYVAKTFIPRAMKRQLSGFGDRAGAPFWMDANWFAQRGVTGAHRPRIGDPFLRGQLARALTGSLRQLLRYEDRNSMAHSVESRVPFLTPDFANLVLSLPAEYVVDARGTRKAVFREAMRGLVPDEILDRRDKLGFQTPEADLLASVAPWSAERLKRPTGAEFAPVLSAHRAAAIDGLARSRAAPASLPLWRWLSTLEWMQSSGVQLG
ncbi:MAG: asparagine synthase (glutamine-hydrolyzing) [Gemmatimonadaceae bacterium]